MMPNADTDWNAIAATRFLTIGHRWTEEQLRHEVGAALPATLRENFSDGFQQE
jgi:hypothetical protein